MQTLFIKFATQEARVRGFYALAKRTGINSLPGKIQDALQILEDNSIDNRRASNEEVKEAHDQVRNPSTAVL